MQEITRTELTNCINLIENAANESILKGYARINDKMIICPFSNGFAQLNVIVIKICAKLYAQLNVHMTEDTELRKQIQSIFTRLENMQFESQAAAEKFYSSHSIQPHSIYPFAFGHIVCELLNISTELKQILDKQ